MRFKELEWEDVISDGIIIASNCHVKIYDSVNVEFRIVYNKEENQYYLYSFGYGCLRKCRAEVFSKLEDAKTTAFCLYNKEMYRMKKAIDSFIVKEDE